MYNVWSFSRDPSSAFCALGDCHDWVEFSKLIATTKHVTSLRWFVPCYRHVNMCNFECPEEQVLARRSWQPDVNVVAGSWFRWMRLKVETLYIYIYIYRERLFEDFSDSLRDFSSQDFGTPGSEDFLETSLRCSGFWHKIDQSLTDTKNGAMYLVGGFHCVFERQIFAFMHFYIHARLSSPVITVDCGEIVMEPVRVCHSFSIISRLYHHTASHLRISHSLMCWSSSDFDFKSLYTHWHKRWKLLGGKCCQTTICFCESLALLCLWHVRHLKAHAPKQQSKSNPLFMKRLDKKHLRLSMCFGWVQHAYHTSHSLHRVHGRYVLDVVLGQSFIRMEWWQDILIVIKGIHMDGCHAVAHVQVCLNKAQDQDVKFSGPKHRVGIASSIPGQAASEVCKSANAVSPWSARSSLPPYRALHEGSMMVASASWPFHSGWWSKCRLECSLKVHVMQK